MLGTVNDTIALWMYHHTVVAQFGGHGWFAATGRKWLLALIFLFVGWQILKAVKGKRGQDAAAWGKQGAMASVLGWGIVAALAFTLLSASGISMIQKWINAAEGTADNIVTQATTDAANDADPLKPFLTTTEG